MSHSQEVKQYFETLKRDLPLYKDVLMEVSGDIRKEGFSRYPVFLAVQDDISVGETVINKDEIGTHWHIKASTLEELTERGIILEERLADFKKAWKNPDTHCCILMITPLGGGFLFIPFQSENKSHKGFDPERDANFSLN
jgi:hypothetical protein